MNRDSGVWSGTYRTKPLTLLFAAWGAWFCFGVAQAGTNALPKLTAADYQARELCGWTIFVQRDLAASPRLEQALDYLESDLGGIRGWFPPSVVAELRQIPIWVSRNSQPGAAYHPSREWLASHGRVPEMARAIEIQNLGNFLDWRETQPAMLLHEFAHAWHHRKFDFNHPAVTAAYQQAVRSGKYEKVRHKDGREQRHYALTNEKEYFAELTEAYFARNDFYPFNRDELRDFDPGGLRMVETVWASATPDGQGPVEGARSLGLAIPSQSVAARTNSSAAITPTGARFTVMSFNVLEAGEDAPVVGFTNSTFGGSRRDDIAAVIRECGADIVGVQECGPVGWLLKELGPAWHGFGTGTWKYHAAMASRFPLEPLVTEEFLTAARVKLPGGASVVLVNIHWWPNGGVASIIIQQRLREGTVPADVHRFAQEVFAASDTRTGPRGYLHTLDLLGPHLRAGENVIVTGDFNCSSHLDWTARAAESGMDRWVKNSTGRPLRFNIEWPGSKALAEAGLRDAYRTLFPDEVAKPGITWTPVYPAGVPGRRPYDDQVLDRIDRIYFAGKSLKLVSAGVVGESKETSEVVHAGPWPSDHRAVTATFVVEPPTNP